MMSNESGQEFTELKSLIEIQKKFQVEICSPLILISQIQRSGGSFLLSLFDNLPNFHTLPQELKIGTFAKNDWPKFDYSAANVEELVEKIGRRKTGWIYQGGYQKEWSLSNSFADNLPSLPINFSPYIFNALLAHNFRNYRFFSQRDGFNSYFTSFFNSWLDYRNLRTAKAKYVVSFRANMSSSGYSVGNFFGTYSDGKLICIVRNPIEWYASWKFHRGNEGVQLTESLKIWRDNVNSIFTIKAHFPTKVKVILYEHLATATEDCFKNILNWLEESTSSVISSTFNGLSLTPNSSFLRHPQHALRDVEFYERKLTKTELAYLNRECIPLYEEVLALFR